MNLKLRQPIVTDEAYQAGIDHFHATGTISNSFGKTLMDACHNYTFHPRFNGYTPHWKEEMRQNAILHLISIINRGMYKAELADKPSSFFTTVIHRDFKKTIKRLSREADEAKAREVLFDDAVSDYQVWGIEQKAFGTTVDEIESGRDKKWIRR